MQGVFGVVPAMGSSHLAEIEMLSNGFVVRFPKAQKIKAKVANLGSVAMDKEIKDLLRESLERLKEGEDWQNQEPKGDKPKDPEFVDKWTVVPVAVMCKDEKELAKVIHEAVGSKQYIDELLARGEFGN